MIHTAGLTYRYAGGPMLVFPDVTVAQGTVLLLSGPSGCGKSTWLALVAALVNQTEGLLQVAGQPLNAIKNSATDKWQANASNPARDAAVCNKDLQTACKGNAIGRFCGMKHEH